MLNNCFNYSSKEKKEETGARAYKHTQCNEVCNLNHPNILCSFYLSL